MPAIVVITAMRMSKPSITFAAVALSFSTLSPLVAEDWPSWRGPSHNGSRTGENYPTKWSADKVAWKVALPGKGATPILPHVFHQSPVSATFPPKANS